MTTRFKEKESKEPRRYGGLTAILVDGGFYRKRADIIFGPKSAKERADELEDYCKRHLTEHMFIHDLYRVLYYDCPPSNAKVYHPFKQEQVDLAKTKLYIWTNDFLYHLKTKRKFALRLGELARLPAFSIKQRKLEDLLRGKITIKDLTEYDFVYSADQKGVDMKIGLDIASLAYKKQVSQIVLISGDSDFVAAAKLARREGIDFVLDPMGAKINENLFEHIDALRSVDPKIRNK